VPLSPHTRLGPYDIWLIDLQRGTSSRLTFDPADDLNPTWSPDGTRIAFSSTRKGHRDIYVRAASGVGEEQALVESEDQKSLEDWSADGQYLVWGSDTTDYEWLFSFGDSQDSAIVKAKFTQDQCRLSPNHGGPPRWIALFVARDRSTAGLRSHLCRRSVGLRRQVADIDRRRLRADVAGDGKELFYLNGNKVMAVEVNGDGESFRAGIPKELFEARLTPEQRRNRFVVTSDGKRFLINALVEEQERASLRVVLNWPALLKH